MSIGLTPKQLELLRYLDAEISANGHPPSYREIAGALDLMSVSGVSRLIEGLVERGYVRRYRKKARALEILIPPPQPERIGCCPHCGGSLAAPESR